MVANGGDAFDRMLRGMHHRVGLDDLPRHLEETYGIDVAPTTKLDSGVVRVDRRDGPAWVARVFPASRPAEAAAGDAAALRHAEEHGFPAERLAADEPLSVLHGQSVLVTTFIPSAPPRRAGRLPGGWGGLQARLHALPLPAGPAHRPAGALHHFAEGTRADEIAAAGAWLDQIEPRVPAADRHHVDRLRTALDESDDGAGLPEAFIHPDVVHVNAVGTEAGPCLIDWTGAGVGPRAVALEYVLRWPSNVARQAAAYTETLPLTDEEWERLPGIAWSRRLVMIAFKFCFAPDSAPKLPGRISAARRQSAKLIAAARAAAAG